MFEAERAVADDGLEVAVGKAGHLLDHAAGVIEKVEAQPGIDAIEHLESHHHRFQRGVAGAIADAIDRHLQHVGARLVAGQHIGDREAKASAVAMQLDLEAGLGLEVTDQEGDGARPGHALAVDNGDIGGAGALGGLGGAGDVLEVGPRRFGRKRLTTHPASLAARTDCSISSEHRPLAPIDELEGIADAVPDEDVARTEVECLPDPVGLPGHPEVEIDCARGWRGSLRASRAP